MKTRTTWLVGTIAITMTLFAGTAFAGKTCEEQEAKEAERLATAAGKCEQKLLDKGCDASACQLPAECVPNPLASPQYVVERSQRGDVIDLRTCLVWERKDDGGGLHDVDNTYAWACDDGTTGADFGLCQPTQEASNACFAGATLDSAGTEAERTVGCRLCDTTSGLPTCYDTTIWEWILAVNAEGLDGHNDWRIPDKGEVESLITDPCLSVPCAAPVIGPTQSAYYWSSTTRQASPTAAWDGDFSLAILDVNDKGNSSDLSVRAVRGGL